MTTPIARNIYTKNGEIQTGFSNINSYKAKIAINSACCCQPLQNVLIWTANCNEMFGGRLTYVQQILTAAGYTCHTTSNWTGNLDDYILILWTMAESNPPWWGSITSGYWAGRILITAEYYSFSYGGWKATYEYVKSISDVTGVSVSEGVLSTAHNRPTNPHPLTENQPFLLMAATCKLSGGTILSTIQEDNTTAWLVERTTTSNFGLPISFVISGDSSFIADHYHAFNYNRNFIVNLASVPVI